MAICKSVDESELGNVGGLSLLEARHIIVRKKLGIAFFEGTLKEANRMFG
jgi:hypothetical protein